MSSFLGELADKLHSKYQNLDNVVLIFPSQRTRLFFSEELSKRYNYPVWEPQFVNLTSLAEKITGLKVADELKLISALYDVYIKYRPSETFDRFFFWGQVMVQDFSLIDNYLVDAERLFSNISDLKELDRLDYLTPEQRQILEQFYLSLQIENPSEEVSQFISLWQVMYEIYTEYRETLKSQNLAYTGMLFREAADMIRANNVPELPRKDYIVVGFNALSECEKVMFDYLKREYGADFAWDVDEYYINDTEQEAGCFVRENVKRFPSRNYATSCDNFKKPKNISVIASATEVSQGKYLASDILPGLLKKYGSLGKETAVVLADEQMLIPVINSISPSLSEINITMGYRIVDTLPCTLLVRLIDLYSNLRQREDGSVDFYHVDVTGILTHPLLTRKLSEDAQAKGMTDDFMRKIVENKIYRVSYSDLSDINIVRDIFRSYSSVEDIFRHLSHVLGMFISAHEDKTPEEKLTAEYIMTLSEVIAKTKNMFSSITQELSLKLAFKILKRYLSSVSVPFKGDPLAGVQIMGILETRNIDFKNVIILSASDDKLPANHLLDTSFIPYNLRFAYGIPTPEKREAVTAYYFYRLIQRAENVVMMYCSTADESSTGEMSRFIRQLEYESMHKIETKSLSMNVSLATETMKDVVKTERMMEIIHDKLRKVGENKGLSPSAFSMYVKCPMQFFFRYVAKIKEQDELEDEVSLPEFGNVFHKAMEILYKPLIGRGNLNELLASITDEEINEKVDFAMADQLFNCDIHDLPDLDKQDTKMYVIRTVVRKYVRNLVSYDIAQYNNAPYKIIDTEREISCEFTLDDGRVVILAGTSDRIDEMSDGTIRIVDYKTGRDVLKFKSVDALFNGSDNERVHNILNTFMYCTIISRYEEYKDKTIVPVLYFIKKINDLTYDPHIRVSIDRKTVPVNSYSEYQLEYEANVRKVLSELIDKDMPFVVAEDPKTCEYCDFKKICKR